MAGQIIGSTGNVPATALAAALGCIIQGPSPYSVTFGAVTAAASPAALPPGPQTLFINSALAAARDSAITNSGLAPTLANYLFFTAYCDYLRQGGY